MALEFEIFLNPNFPHNNTLKKNVDFPKKIPKEVQFWAKFFKMLSGRLPNSHMKKNWIFPPILM